MEKKTTNQRCLLVFLGVTTALLLPGLGCRRDESKTVSVIGSTSILPFAELLAEEYAKKAPGCEVKVQGGGSTAGIKAVADGLAQIGTCSRLLTEEEAKSFTPITIARDGLALIVNKGNAVNGLKLEQLRDIFSGKIKSWKEVGGKDEVIVTVTREEGSGTRESMEKLVMGKDKISRNSLVQESTGAVQELVKNNPAAVGYISLGQVSKDVKPLVIDGVEPVAANVLEGKYKLVRPFLFVVKGQPKPEAQAFIDYVLSPEGQKILESEGLYRAK